MLRTLRMYDKAISVLEMAKKLYPGDGTPSRILYALYSTLDPEMYKIEVDNAMSKPCLNFNRVIREWETDNQFLKPIEEDFV